MNHVGGHSSVVNVDMLELKETGGKYGNAAEGGALRKRYKAECARRPPSRHPMKKHVAYKRD